MLPTYKKEFIEFALAQDVLRFGEFELKSGRISPWFFNAGEFKTGSALARVGSWYAAALQASGIRADCLFGAAYKGIPLVVATALALASEHGVDLPWVFNRKEAKDHGEGGRLVGAPLQGDVVIVDDIITAGTALREVMPFFDASEARAVAVLVAVDRQERGKGEMSAIQEAERGYGLSVIRVVNLDDIVEYLTTVGGHEQELEKIADYRKQYGATD